MKRIFTPAKKKTILILDEDQFVTQSYRQKLEAQGFKVELTRAFDSALQILKNEVVDLVILDLCLPGINLIELIKTIRSDFETLPILTLSNPYLSSLTRAAAEAGATKSVTKVGTTPEQIIELARELGVSATPKAGAGGMAGALDQGSNFSINTPATLAKLRASYQSFTRTEREDLRRVALLQMHRQLRLLAGSASTLALRNIVQMSAALEALLIELYAEPEKTTPSIVRTIAHCIETLASLFDGGANSQDDRTTSTKVLVVDDEVISRQLMCSALEMADLHAVSLDDPLAAQRLLEREHFDLIFLDIEMPGQTGLELCVKIRGMEPNRTTPIVFVTSHSDFGSRAQSTLSGGNDFIAKPFLLVEVALKAFTWLVKESLRSSRTASVQNRVQTEMVGQGPQLGATDGASELHRTSAAP
jgi:DNA-binding response OmpR family regulator